MTTCGPASARAARRGARIKSPVSLWKWKRENRSHPAKTDRRSSREFPDGLRFQSSDPRRALAEVERVLLDLKAHDPGLARDCAYRLMALIVKWGWQEHTVKSAGVAAGLDEGRAARWARKLFAMPTESSQKKSACTHGKHKQVRREGST